MGSCFSSLSVSSKPAESLLTKTSKPGRLLLVTAKMSLCWNNQGWTSVVERFQPNHQSGACVTFQVFPLSSKLAGVTFLVLSLSSKPTACRGYGWDKPLFLSSKPTACSGYG